MPWVRGPSGAHASEGETGGGAGSHPAEPAALRLRGPDSPAGGSEGISEGASFGSQPATSHQDPFNCQDRIPLRFLGFLERLGIPGAMHEQQGRLSKSGRQSSLSLCRMLVQSLQRFPTSLGLLEGEDLRVLTNLACCPQRSVWMEYGLG